MTITFNRFALLPKRCDKCGRRFVWEPYYSYKYDREVGFQTFVMTGRKCRECIDGARGSKG